MSRFVIADLTDAKSVLQELQAIVPKCPSVPVQPLMLAPRADPGMLDFFKGLDWFLKIFRYENQTALLTGLQKVIERVETKVERIRG